MEEGTMRTSVPPFPFLGADTVVWLQIVTHYDDDLFPKAFL